MEGLAHMELVIDQGTCVGHGRCYALHPELFGSDDYGYGSVTRPRVEGDDVPSAEDAVLECPERAVQLLAATDATSH